MGNKKLFIIVLLSFFSLIMITCKHEIPIQVNVTVPGGGDSTTTTNPCSPDTVYFSSEIFPLINSYCATSNCHDALTRAGDIDLTNYSNIKKLTVPFNAANSSLYRVTVQTGENAMPPPPMTPFTAAQITQLQKWINQGALNNQCSAGCDTALYTYIGAVSITMNTYCKGCHNPASLGGGIDLSTFATVKATALGRLMGSINHTAGYSAMPKGGNKLTNCQITQIQKWILAGTLNN